MGDIGDTINKFLRFDFKKAVLKILNSKKVSDFVIEMQQARLYNTGKDSEGDSLGSYSPFTVVIKQAKGQRTDHITLRDTGEFYESMTFHATGTALIFDADAQKDEDNLFDNFGIDILGLTDFDKERLIELIYQELRFLLIYKL
jgi:hypothetical protein